MHLVSNIDCGFCELQNRREENSGSFDKTGFGPRQHGLCRYINSKPYWYNSISDSWESWPTIEPTRYVTWQDAGEIGFRYDVYSDRFPIEIDVSAHQSYTGDNQVWGLYQDAASAYISNDRVLGTLEKIGNMSNSGYSYRAGNYFDGMKVKIVCEKNCSMLLNFGIDHGDYWSNYRRIIHSDFPTLEGLYSMPVRWAIFQYVSGAAPPGNDYNKASGAWLMIACEPVAPYEISIDIPQMTAVYNPGRSCYEINAYLPAADHLPYEGYYDCHIALDVTETGRRTGSENLNDIWTPQTLEIFNGAAMPSKIVAKSSYLTGTTPTNGLVFRNEWLAGSRLCQIANPLPDAHRIMFRVNFYSGSAAQINSGYATIRYLGALRPDVI